MVAQHLWLKMSLCPGGSRTEQPRTFIDNTFDRLLWVVRLPRRFHPTFTSLPTRQKKKKPT